MRCEMCGTENLDGSKYCKECRSPLRDDVPPPPELAEVTEEGKPSAMAKMLSTAWARRGPILITISVVLLMSMVFAPWAFVELDVLGITLVSRRFSGWAIFIPRILFFLSFIPLIIAILMVAGIGTRRRAIETHICTFFSGVMFTIWLIIFALSLVLKSLLKHLHVVHVNPAAGQVATIVLLVAFIFGIIITSYDRGRILRAAGKGG